MRVVKAPNTDKGNAFFCANSQVTYSLDLPSLEDLLRPLVVIYKHLYYFHTDSFLTHLTEQQQKAGYNPMYFTTFIFKARLGV